MRACEKVASSGGAHKADRLLKSVERFLGVAGRLEEKVRGDIDLHRIGAALLSAQSGAKGQRRKKAA